MVSPSRFIGRRAASSPVNGYDDGSKSPREVCQTECRAKHLDSGLDWREID
jgi:hypothetical protein